MGRRSLPSGTQTIVTLDGTNKRKQISRRAPGGWRRPDRVLCVRAALCEERSRENRTSSRESSSSRRDAPSTMLAKLRLFQSKYVFYELFFSLTHLYTRPCTRALCHPLGFHLVFARGPFYVSVIAIDHLRPPCASGDRKLQLYFRLSPIADLRIFGFYGDGERKHRTPRFSRTSYHTLLFTTNYNVIRRPFVPLLWGLAFSSGKRVSRFWNACFTSFRDRSRSLSRGINELLPSLTFDSLYLSSFFLPKYTFLIQRIKIWMQLKQTGVWNPLQLVWEKKTQGSWLSYT